VIIETITLVHVRGVLHDLVRDLHGNLHHVLLRVHSGVTLQVGVFPVDGIVIFVVQVVAFLHLVVHLPFEVVLGSQHGVWVIALPFVVVDGQIGLSGGEIHHRHVHGCVDGSVNRNTGERASLSGTVERIFDEGHGGRGGIDAKGPRSSVHEISSKSVGIRSVGHFHRFLHSIESSIVPTLHVFLVLELELGLSVVHHEHDGVVHCIDGVREVVDGLTGGPRGFRSVRAICRDEGHEKDEERETKQQL